MSELESTSESFLPVNFLVFAREDFLDLCEHNVRDIKDLVNGGKLLNQKQCQDLSSKLSVTIRNVQELISYSRASMVLFRPALEKLYRCLEKAKLLVTNCAEKDWCAAAVFQCQNENAFLEILLDVSFCYNAIYEQAKTKGKDWNDPPQDLRQSPLFERATDGDVLEDRQKLQKRLDELASGHTNFKGLDFWIPGRATRKQNLAKYLLDKMYYTRKEPRANTFDTYSAILWRKVSEPPGTWGNSRFLGSGSGAAGVCGTTWLGIPCAKKEFHGLESESSFMKEAGILAHLKHPCIVNFISCGNGLERGDRFIAMELLEKSLFDLIKEQKQKGEHFSVPVAVDMMVQMARGVSYLHGQGVAHRDLKPQNVVVNRLSFPHVADHYCVKLVDFEVSKTEVEVSKSNTMSYRGIGTTMYRAPEAHPKANPDGIGKVNWFKADAFSFAMTCAHLLFLESPFGNKGPGELYNEHAENEQRSKFPAMYPQELVALVMDCWRANSRSRPSFVEICVRLERFQHKLLRGYAHLDQALEEDKHDLSEGFHFITMKLESITKQCTYDNDGAKGETFDNIVSICACDHGHALQLQPQPPSYYRGCLCNMCWELVHGEVYHCEVCQFDAHPHCVEIKEKVEVFFHEHPLYLLVQNYYNDKSDGICCFCEESVQDSEWVYRCEQCDFDVHAQCSRFPKEQTSKRAHEHILTARQCPPSKSLSCTCCNGKVKEYSWRYTCQLQSCSVDLHPLCTTRQMIPPCVFDTSHRIALETEQTTFQCSRCGAPGFSWSYHCSTCDVDIHPDCIDAIYDDKRDWKKDYEKLVLESGSKDNRTRVGMISEFLDKVPINDALEPSSSSMSLTPQVEVMTRIQPPFQRLSLGESPSLEASKDVNLQRHIAAITKKRIKYKKQAAKEARQQLQAGLLEMLGNVERIFQNMQSSKSMSQDDTEALAATHKKLKSRQALVKKRMAMQVQSKMGQGPRIAVFFLNMTKGGWLVGRKLLTNLQADMKGVCFAFLCEEPGHEHIVDGLIYNVELGKERAEKLQALVAPGLQVVRKAMRTLEPHELTALHSVTLPCLESVPWDLRAIARFEEHGNESSDPISEDTEQAESLERAVDCAAEWFRSHLENNGVNILETMGLRRVRYKVIEEDNDPKYRRGSMAWLCSDHVSSGLKAGTLESYPLKYYDVEVDYELRFPHVKKRQ